MPVLALQWILTSKAKWFCLLFAGYAHLLGELSSFILFLISLHLVFSNSSQWSRTLTVHSITGLNIFVLCFQWAYHRTQWFILVYYCSTAAAVRKRFSWVFWWYNTWTGAEENILKTTTVLIAGFEWAAIATFFFCWACKPFWESYYQWSSNYSEGATAIEQVHVCSAPFAGK